jgi:hypothetical protein
VVLVRVCEDVGTLQRLWEETEDVVDDQERGFGVLGTSGISLHAIDGDELALLLVALGDDGRDGAASFGLCRHGSERSRGPSVLWWSVYCLRPGLVVACKEERKAGKGFKQVERSRKEVGISSPSPLDFKYCYDR